MCLVITQGAQAMNRMGKILLIFAMGASTPVFADLNLVKDKQCMQCHDISIDRVGPSFQRIAKRWKGNPAAEKLLTSTIQQGTQEGGGQHWSSKANMPDSQERPMVSDVEAVRIVKWIMSLR
jgi:cytochrome c